MRSVELSALFGLILADALTGRVEARVCQYEHRHAAAQRVMMADSPTKAQAVYALLRPDRKSMFDAMVSEARKRPGAERLNLSIDHLVGELDGIEVDHGDVMLRDVLKKVLVAIDRAGLAQGYAPRLDLLEIGATDDEDVTAHLLPQHDGSGLVILSDALIGLLLHLCQMVAIYMAPGAHTMEILRNRLRGEVEKPIAEGVEFVSGVLRYYLIHRRVFDRSAKLGIVLTERQDDFARYLFQLAIQFVVAHEVAHFVLGHTVKSHALLTRHSLPVATDDVEAELAADSMAAKIVMSIEVSGSRRGWGTYARSLAVLGSSIAVWSIDGTERAEFIRTGSSHPPGAVRMEHVRRNLTSFRNDSVLALLSTVAAATQLASDFSKPLPGPYWARAYGSPVTDTTVCRPQYYDSILEYDLVQAPERARFPEIFAETASEFGLDMTGGLGRALAGDVRGALREWNLSEAVIDDVVDSSHALQFYSLQNAIFEANLLPDKYSTIRRRSALMAASAVQDGLRGW